MPIILESEKRLARTRMLRLLLHALLSVGAVAMVYPFLLMASGSLKSRVDVQDLDIIPRYLYDDGMLYRKYAEAKYNERIADYRAATGDASRNFREVSLPEEGTGDRVVLADWQKFLEFEDLPASWYLTGFGPTPDCRIVQKNERAFRQYVSELCGGDLGLFRSRFDEPIESWFFLKLPPERLADRKYQLSATPLMQAFYDFKAGLPPEDRIYVSCEAVYRNYLKLSGNDPADAILPARSDGPAWDAFVRHHLHPQFIVADAGLLPHWGAFLQRKYRGIEQLNKLYAKHYADFSEVPFPLDKMTSSPQLTDFLSFISTPEACPAEGLSLDTPELRWRGYFRKRHESIDRLRQAHGRAYPGFHTVGMPQQAMDRSYVLSHGAELRGEFAANNYRMVLEYILFYGNGIRNTAIYCLASIALALLVNPLAAYALSRYQLPGQYKILLFLIATMAFPGVVTMIPNFLLLRDLGLLNTFAALLLPTMANGYSIFLLKGFFDSLPAELFEAAELDGAGEWQKFWMITMNLSKPVLAVVALGAFTAAYGNFMYAFVLCQDKDMWTLAVWLYQLQQFSSQGVVHASLMVAAIPTLAVFTLCQRMIMRGIVVPTEK